MTADKGGVDYWAEVGGRPGVRVSDITMQTGTFFQKRFHNAFVHEDP